MDQVPDLVAAATYVLHWPVRDGDAEAGTAAAKTAAVAQSKLCAAFPWLNSVRGQHDKASAPEFLFRLALLFIEHGKHLERNSATVLAAGRALSL